MKKKKVIKAKPWQIFSYYIMPFILGIITFFGFSKIVLSSTDNKLYTLLDLISKFNQNTILSSVLSLFLIGIAYLLYLAIYTEEKDKTNFNRITYKSIIIPLLALIGFYFLPNIFVFLLNINSILIHDEKYKYTYLLIHILWTYSILGLIYYKDKDFLKIMKIHYSFVLFIFIMLSMMLVVISEDSFITIILEHRLRTIFMFWFAFCLPYITYVATWDNPNFKYKYKNFLLIDDVSDGLLLISACFIIGSIIYHCLGNIFAKVYKYLGDSLYNLILKLNSVSYIPVILTTLTIIFIGFAIYKTTKYMEEK